MSVIPNPQTLNITNNYTGIFPITVGSWISTTPTITIATNPVYTTLSFPTPTAIVNLSNPSGSAVVVPDNGVYRILYSLQFLQTAGNGYSEVFLLRNGSPLPLSNSVESFKNGDYDVLTVEFLLQLSAGDAVGLAATSTAGTSTIVTLAAAPPIPASPAVVFTVQRVG